MSFFSALLADIEAGWAKLFGFSGANVAAALRVASSLAPGAIVVTLLCDRAERYFSTPLFAEADNTQG